MSDSKDTSEVELDPNPQPETSAEQASEVKATKDSVRIGSLLVLLLIVGSLVCIYTAAH